MLAHLRRRGYEVCVLEEDRAGRHRPWTETPCYRHEDDGIRTIWYDPHRGLSRVLTWPMDRVFRRAFEGRNLVNRMWVVRRAIRRFMPDALVCTDGFTYAIPAALLKASGIVRQPLLASYIGGDILDCPDADVGKRRTPMVNWLIRMSVRHVDAMRPLCRSLAEILIAEGADPAKVGILPIQLSAPQDLLDAVRADRSAVSVRIRRRYGIELDAPLVVTLSGNQKGKGLHLLADQWPRVLDRHPRARWLLCGPHDRWLDAAVLPRLAATGCVESIVLSGPLSGRDVYEHLAAADIHANPTLCEGLNMVTVEAAAVGTPTVTSNGAGVADWVERLGCGLVVQARDAEALGSAVIDALSDRDRLLTWQVRCSTMAPDFEVTRIADGLIGMLRAITAPSAHPPEFS